MIEFNPQSYEYSVIGSKGQVKALDRTKVVITILPGKPPGMTPGEIRDAWSGESIPRPGEKCYKA